MKTKNLILKLDSNPSQQTSKEGIRINRLNSSISPSNFIKLFKLADNKVNPRTAKIGPIIKSIHETLETSPELFWFKSKGILLSTENCKFLDRNRIEISLDDEDHEGIMDGGHNTLAIASFIIEKLFSEKIKTWEECKNYWEEHYDEIINEFDAHKEKFSNFSIPIEIIFPNDDLGSQDDFYKHIAEICAARNNNVQLTAAARGNKEGYYDYLKDKLGSNFKVIWKNGESGIIRAEDVIAMSVLPLICLKEENLLPTNTKSISRISLYSGKGKCVEFYNSILDHEEISNLIDGIHVLNNSYVESALDMTEDILKFFDRLYVKFPELYNNFSPGFGRIGSVERHEVERPALFKTQKSKIVFPPGFIYPLLCGLTSLMEVNADEKKIQWKKKPTTINLSSLNLDQYVDLIKVVNYDAQKVGKSELFYRESQRIFEAIS